MLVYLVDITDEDPVATRDELQKELEQFDASLLLRPSVVVLSKIDLCQNPEERRAKQAVFDSPPFLLSAVSREGVDAWIRQVFDLHRVELERQLREAREEDET